MPRKNEYVTQKIKKNRENDAKKAFEWSKKYHKKAFGEIEIEYFKNNILKGGVVDG
jgi:hypothetical protein